MICLILFLFLALIKVETVQCTAAAFKIEHCVTTRGLRCSETGFNRASPRARNQTGYVIKEIKNVRIFLHCVRFEIFELKRFVSARIGDFRVLRSVEFRKCLKF